MTDVVNVRDVAETTNPLLHGIGSDPLDQHVARVAEKPADATRCCSCMRDLGRLRLEVAVVQVQHDLPAVDHVELTANHTSTTCDVIVDVVVVAPEHAEAMGVAVPASTIWTKVAVANGGLEPGHIPVAIMTLGKKTAVCAGVKVDHAHAGDNGSERGPA